MTRARADSSQPAARVRRPGSEHHSEKVRLNTCGVRTFRVREPRRLRATEEEEYGAGQGAS